jgi:hypothetical protein
MSSFAAHLLCCSFNSTGVPMPLMTSVLLALAPPAPLMDCGTLRFSVSPAMAGGSQQVGVCRDRNGRPGEVLLQRTTTRRGGSAVISYASTRSCPAARRQLEALEDLPLPHPDVPGIGDETRIMTLDGASYRLEGEALYGPNSAEMRVESNVGTPLAHWIDATLAALMPCWRDRPEG